MLTPRKSAKQIGGAGFQPGSCPECMSPTREKTRYDMPGSNWECTNRACRYGKPLPAPDYDERWY